MLRSDLTVAVDIALAFRTVEDLSLVHREQFVAIGALVQVIPFFLKKQLKLFHEKSTHKFVLPLLEHIQSIK